MFNCKILAIANQKGKKAASSSTFISEATKGIASTFYFEAIRLDGYL